MNTDRFTDAELEQFRDFQRRSYAIRQSVLDQLDNGITERDTILDAVRSRATFKQIAVDVDAQLTAAGYSNRHQLHPGAVLGHRVAKLERAVEPDQDGFDQTLIGWFVKNVAAPTPPSKPSPTWGAFDGSDHPPAHGLWAVEPHIARDGIGVKWEELLAVAGADAYWLDDTPPHTITAA